MYLTSWGHSIIRAHCTRVYILSWWMVPYPHRVSFSFIALAEPWKDCSVILLNWELLVRMGWYRISGCCGGQHISSVKWESWFEVVLCGIY